jgi:methionyl-tRNA formyltransferase
MRVIVAKSTGPEGDYFCRRMTTELDGVVAVITQQTSPRKPPGKRHGVIRRLISRLQNEGFSSLKLMAYEYVYMKNEVCHIRRTKEKYFSFPDSGKTLAVPEFKASDINVSEVAEFARSFNADMLTVQGTSILKEPLLSMFPSGILNIHGGLPRYRGVWPMFWALYNEDFDYLKSSLHYINAGIDTGDVILEKKLDLEPDDDHHSLRAKYLVEGTALMIEAVRRLSKGEMIPRMPQDKMEADGRCYFAREITREKRIELDRKLRKGLIRKHLAHKNIE